MGAISRSFRVVVIGAGPAGANAALHLARGGAHVALVEKALLPRYKTCGGGVVARALRELPDDVILPVEHACRSVEMRFANQGMSYHVAREEPIVSMTMRADLDRALVEAARQSGAEIRTGCAVRAITASEHDVAIQTDGGDLSAEFVIVADGATGPCARMAGFTTPLATIPALEAEVRVPRAEFERHRHAAVFDFGSIEAGYGWVFPKRDHLSVGVLTMKRGTSGVREALQRYLVEADIRDIESLETHGYVIPIRPRRELSRGRVMLAGDAAGLVDPVTGEGISLALRSGRLAARALLDEDLAVRAVTRAYERSVRREIVSELRIAAGLARVLYEHPLIQQKLFELNGQGLCEAVADVVAGRSSYRRALMRPRNWLRLLPALVR